MAATGTTVVVGIVILVVGIAIIIWIQKKGGSALQGDVVKIYY